MIRPGPAVVRAWTAAILCLARCGCEARTDEATAPSTSSRAAAPAPVPNDPPAASAPSIAPAPAAITPTTATAPAAQELLTDAPPTGAREPQAAPSTAAAPQTNAAEPAVEYEYRPGSPDGIGKWYLGREIAHVMGHQGARWLERAEREEEERPSLLVDLLKRRLEPDDVFADIGAGTGYYSFRLAPLVPKGKVYAVDIQQEMLDLMGKAAAKKDIRNVEPVLGTVDDPKLPADAVDWVLLVDAYHEFDHPREMLRGVRNALKPGGKVLLVEFRAEDPNVPIKALHKMSEDQAKRELNAAGLRHVETLRQLPWQHVMIFEKPR